MKRALLIVGDERIAKRRPYISYLKFVTYAKRLFHKRNLELKITNYHQLFSGKAPRIENPSMIVVLFFPYRYWNRHIEIYRDNRIYGDKLFGRKFKDFLKKVKQTVDKCYSGKRIIYLNHPQACFLDRDKLASKDLLRRAGLAVPRTFSASSFKDIQRLIKKGKNIYIKPRFGSLGKGLTYIDGEKIVSNFNYRRGKIISRISDSDWPFRRIKDERSFLNQLLGRGFICEEAIKSAVHKNKRFDFRVYVINGRVVYLYAKSSPAQSWVTNWSQGGRIDKKRKILRTVPKKKIMQMRSLAKRAAAALGLNFAGIDIIFSEDFKQAYVLEGNAFPGYEKGFNLQKCLIDQMLK
jgi:glutathione synthase/RimK-type ligase-like ATP-grasp enzyme